jgi:hypothetical protein
VGQKKGDKAMNWASELVYLTNLIQHAVCRERDAGQISIQK